MAARPGRRAAASSSNASLAQRTGGDGEPNKEPVEMEKEPVVVVVPTGDLRLALTEQSPSLKFLNDIRMDRLLDKLSLLNYTSVLQNNGARSGGLPRDYFVADKAEYAVERFHVFANLAVWMVRQLGLELAQPKERDDPNVTVTAITDALRKLKVQVEHTTHRLKSGSGAEVVNILYELASQCLKQRAEFLGPSFPDSKLGGDEEEVQEEEEDAEDVFEAIPSFDWDHEEVAEDLNEMEFAADDQQQTAGDLLARQRAAEEWRLEADRLAPFFNRPDGLAGERLGWSDRIRKLDLCRKELEQNVELVSGKLSAISAEISRSTEKIHNREKYVSVNHRDKVERFRAASSKLTSAKTRYEAHSTEVEANARKLADVTAEFEKLKRRVEEKGNSMGDRVAITNMKSAMKRMKEEMGIYNIKCAMAQLRLQELAEMLENAEIEHNLTDMETIGVLPARATS